MSIKRLLKDVFERVDTLDKSVVNPFLKRDENKNNSNPFAKFYEGTYIWIEPVENENRSEKY